MAPLSVTYAEPTRTNLRSSGGVDHESSDPANAQFKFRADLQSVLQAIPHFYEMEVIDQELTSDTVCGAKLPRYVKSQVREHIYRSNSCHVIGTSNRMIWSKKINVLPSTKHRNLVDEGNHRQIAGHSTTSVFIECLETLPGELLNRAILLRPDIKPFLSYTCDVEMEHVDSQSKETSQDRMYSNVTDDDLLHFLDSHITPQLSRHFVDRLDNTVSKNDRDLIFNSSVKSELSACPKISVDSLFHVTRVTIDEYRQYMHAAISFDLKNMVYPESSFCLSSKALDSIILSDKIIKGTPVYKYREIVKTKSTFAPLLADFILLKSSKVALHLLDHQLSQIHLLCNPHTLPHFIISMNGTFGIKSIDCLCYHMANDGIQKLLVANIALSQICAQSKEIGIAANEHDYTCKGSDRGDAPNAVVQNRLRMKRTQSVCDIDKESVTLVDYSAQNIIMDLPSADSRPQITPGVECDRFSLRTRASCCAKDKFGRPTENGVKCAVSHDHAVIALSLTVGHLKFIAVKATLNNNDGTVEHFNAHVDSCPIKAMEFLSNNDSLTYKKFPLPSPNKKRTLCVIFQCLHDASKVCLYELSLREKFLKPTSYIHYPTGNDSQPSEDNKERTKTSAIACVSWDMSTHSSLCISDLTNLVIPTMFGGALFVGREKITFYPKLISEPTTEYLATDYQQFTGSDYISKSIESPDVMRISYWAAVRSTDSDLRFIISDHKGILFLVWITIQPKHKRINDIYSIDNYLSLNIEKLGNVSSGSKMIPLPNNHFFICSRNADHQLVKLYRTPRNSMRHSPHHQRCPFRGVRVLASYCNIAPITDAIFLPTRLSNTPLDYKSKSNLNSINALDHWTLATCSNVGDFGSIRFLRKSAMFREKVICRSPNLQRAFYLAISDHESLLLLSSSTKTLVTRCKWPSLPDSQSSSFHFRPESSKLPPLETSFNSVSKQDMSVFDLCNPTLHAEQYENIFLQITTKQVTLLELVDGFPKPVHWWNPYSSEVLITNCATCLSLNTIIVILRSRYIVGIKLATHLMKGHTRQFKALKTTNQICLKKDQLISCVDIVNYKRYPILACAMSNEPSILLISTNQMDILATIDLSCTLLKSCCHTLSFVQFGMNIYLAIADVIDVCAISRLNLLLRPTHSQRQWKHVKLSKRANFIREINIVTDRSNKNETSKALLIGGQHSLFLTGTGLNDLSVNDVNCESLISCSSVSRYSNKIILVKSLSVMKSPADKQHQQCMSEVSLCFLSDESVTHINTLRLKESPRRLTYHKSSDCLAVLVWHKFPNFKLKSSEIKDYLHKFASYRAYNHALQDTILPNDQVDQTEAFPGGLPFAADLIERDYRVHRPATKRRRSNDEDRMNESSNTTQSEDTIMTDMDENGEAKSSLDKLMQKCIKREEHSIILVNRASGYRTILPRFECSYFLKPEEHGCSVTTWSVTYPGLCTGVDLLSQAENEYIVVGTGTVKENEVEPKTGRMMLFSVRRTMDKVRLSLVNQVKLEGAAFSMSQCKEYLVVSINYAVHLYGITWTANLPQMVLISTHSGNSLSLLVKTLNYRCLVGDLVRSIELLRVASNVDTNQDCPNISQTTSTNSNVTFKSLARDIYPNWVTAVEILQKDLFN